MNRNRYFRRGGRGVFKCAICERGTREAGQGNDRLCPECYELAGLENMIFDGHSTAAELANDSAALLKRIIKRGGNAEKVRKDFATLFPTEETR